MKTRKRYRPFLLALCLCLSLAACGSPDGDELFDTAVLPTDELGDEDWQFGEMSLSDFSGDYNSDLRLTLFHEDMSESYIVWEWEKNAGYLYQPYDSYFRESRVVDEPPADDILTEQT